MLAGLVSTIIPVYNRAALLREAVGSVLAQTYRPIEVVIVDDGSTDDTPAVCRELEGQHPDIVRVVRQPNAGPGSAREAGRQLARGEFLQYLDSDDLLLPRKFERQVAALRAHPECGVAYCYARNYRIGETPVDIPWRGSGCTVDAMFPSFLLERWWDTPAPLYRRTVCDQAGPWINVRDEDWEYDCRIAALGTRLVHCKEFLVDYRDHAQPRISQGTAYKDAVLQRDRARAHALIYQHARRAGLGPDNPEMQHFARRLFLLARQCGAAGLASEARQLFELSREASGSYRARRLDFRLYRLAAACLGWRWAGQLACWLDHWRPSREPTTVCPSRDREGAAERPLAPSRSRL
jgi:glycosyltransferase involved in cell wall biosynthesis